VYVYMHVYLKLFIAHPKYAYETSSVRQIFKSFRNKATAQIGTGVRVRVFESRTVG
jgi:hypothetical protein